MAGLLLLALLIGGAASANAQAPTVKVTILKYLDGVAATATSANNSSFAVNANWNATNLGGAGSGQFNLSSTGYNGNPTPYQAMTAAMSSGSSYSVSEVQNGTLVGSSCPTGNNTGAKYTTRGYTYGDTLAAAQTAQISTTAPNLTNITTDKYIIIWNTTCNNNVVGGTNGAGRLVGQVTGGTQPGSLHVDSVVAVDTTAVADGTFANGWQYTFNVTIPTNESNLAMKFSDWTRIGGGGIIPAANNIRISSAQADNSGATVLVTGANIYSSPTLHMITDLDPSTPGTQVQVKVEVAVPSTTPNGSYATNYGVKTI